MLLGLGMFSYGAYNGWVMRRALTSMFVFPMVFGFILTGIAAILCGHTNGFTDHSQFGRKLKKVAIFLAIAGLPLLGYVAWRSI